MGEYIQLANGEVVKVGTCEDCYYSTLEQLRAAVDGGAVKVSGNLEPAEYLKPQHGFRYRFPFPDERRMAIGTHDPYDRGVTVEIPETLLHTDHDVVRLRMYAKGAERDRTPFDPYTYGLQVTVGCPFNPDPAQRPQTSEVVPVAQVVQQKQVEGALWVVLRCPYCENAWRVSPDDGATLVAHLRERYAQDRFILDIAAEIERGYRVAQAVGP
jgi:hypothetical protein